MNKKVNWKFDDFGSPSYNAAGALETMLINLDIVSFDDQWSIETMEEFSNKFGVTDDSAYKKLMERLYGKNGSWDYSAKDGGINREITNPDSGFKVRFRKSSE